MTLQFCKALGIAMIFAITGCASTDPAQKTYKVLVLNQAGEVIENASVTPKAKGHAFKPKFTKIDGMVDLNDVYSQKPTTIMVRAIGYRTRVVAWTLPSEKPLTVVMTLLSIPDE